MPLNRSPQVARLKPLPSWGSGHRVEAPEGFVEEGPAGLLSWKGRVWEEGFSFLSLKGERMICFNQRGPNLCVIERKKVFFKTASG